MNYVVEGILFGLMLTILLGPIFIALTQTSIEKGGRAGMTVGVGVWTSDLLIISISYLFIRMISSTVESEGFKFWLGLAGGIVLMIFGIGAFMKQINFSHEKQHFTAKNYFGFWLKGFLVNTINPFTFIFWIGVISTYVIGRQISTQETVLFLGTILLTIVVTDSMKVYLAKLIRRKFQEKHIYVFTKLAGIGLFLFGIFLIVKSV